MAKKNKKGTEIKAFRKKIALTLFTKLDTVLKDYQPVIGEKKYTNHLKKVAKSLAGEIAVASKKMKEKLDTGIKDPEEKNSSEIIKNLKSKKRKRKELKAIKSPTEVSLPEPDADEDDD